MSGTVSPQTAAMQAMQQNMTARAQLLATGTRYNIQLAPVTTTSGGNFQIALDRFGITTGITIRATVTLDITAAMTPSLLAPFNALQNLTYTDFGGLQHTSQANGAILQIANGVRKGRIPYATSSPANIAGLAQSSTLLQVPTAVASAATFQVSVELPLAVHAESDLTGAVLSQTGQGTHYVSGSIFGNGVVGADPVAYPYTAGTATISNVVIQVEQHCIMPQTFTALPTIDLTTVYGFQTQIETDAFAAGLDHYSYWPNGRTILSALHLFDNGSTLNFGSDLSLIRKIANTNTILEKWNPTDFLFAQRDKLYCDLFPGLYYFGNRRQPVVISQIGQVASVFTPSSIGSAGVVQMTSQFEVQYPSGMPLPGLITG